MTNSKKKTDAEKQLQENAKIQLEEKNELLEQKVVERERAWKECWEKKIKEKERIEDCRACCAPDDYYREPKTQNNVWIQINHEKSSQHVYLTFKNVPIPQPNPPPVPKIPICTVIENNISTPYQNKKKKKVSSSRRKKKGSRRGGAGSSNKLDSQCSELYLT